MKTALSYGKIYDNVFNNLKRKFITSRPDVKLQWYEGLPEKKEDQTEESYQQLIEAIKSHIDWVRQHHDAFQWKPMNDSNLR